MRDHDDERLLALYLNDHLTGAHGGAALARRIARAHPEGPAAAELRTLAREITEDRDELVHLMRALGVRPRWHRRVLGAAAEKTGRLKLNGRLVRRSPLSDLLELEALRAGVQGKRALWRALRAATAEEPLGGASSGSSGGSSSGSLDAELRRLETRAERQAELLDARQREAAGVLRPVRLRKPSAVAGPRPVGRTGSRTG